MHFILSLRKELWYLQDSLGKISFSRPILGPFIKISLLPHLWHNDYDINLCLGEVYGHVVEYISEV